MGLDLKQQMRIVDQQRQEPRERASEERIEEISQRLAAIVDSSDDAIISKDLNGIIQSWNQGAERLFGYTAAEVIGKPVTILMPPDRQSEEPAILQRIRQGERIDHYETVRQRKDGSLIDISLTTSPVRDGKGRVVGASKIARDISLRKQAERTIRELSTPVLEVQERLLVLPLIGTLDAERCRQLTHQLLECIREQRARAVVIDLTGIAGIDAAGANHLRQTIRAARLLGAETILSGISRSTAETLTGVGFTSGDAITVSNLRAGIETANGFLTPVFA